MSYGVNLFFIQFSNFVQGLFAGQLVVGGIFTNFMLVTVLGFIALKLFISLSLYETPLVPTRLQSIYEVIYGVILGMVCEQTGSKVGEKFMPAYLTLFFTVLSANVIALFPYTYSITSQLIVTFTISFFAFVAINLVGFLHHGVFLLGMLLPKGCPLAIVPAIVLIETVSYVFRVVSLALRIFANILSGHCMLKIVTIFV
jgi:ATP synthase subunit 6